MASVTIGKNIEREEIVVSFSYDPKLVAKVKSIEGHRWHADKKYWSFPYSENILKRIMSVFKNENIYLGSLPRPRKEKKLPIVLSREDVIRIFESVNNIKHKAILMLAYSSGLRVSEVVYTHVSQRDIGRIKSPLDFGRR